MLECKRNSSTVNVDAECADQERGGGGGAGVPDPPSPEKLKKYMVL